ncbi:hypothetical protein QYE76_059958 [Lolium multiflorum]|uniref:1,3-beta-glucan synthase component FKS1-like domain-containing protein n=1 Tax=Lolium multiflorum TaxID=4521 RepID=A0AAD8W3T6_LOLMU|nr:hypothetical protein QYE76_059958 [Lolium multiflorum]
MPMSSGGGTSNPRRAYFSMPREKYPDEDGDGIIEDTELVPPTSLAPIVPILRAADEIQADNPRVAYLCRLVAWEKARAIDPAASVRGVGRFQARLVQRLEKEKMETQRRLASTDAKEVQRFYERYCNKQIEEGVQMRKPDGIATYYQTASVLFDVLKSVTPEKFRPQFVKYGKTLEKEKASLHYNILPLNISGPTQPVMDIPEIKAAVELLRSVQNLPQPRPSPASVPEEIDEPIIRDLLDLLWQTFGFQKSNVENQKEHLILLLANIEMSEGSDFHQVEKYDCTIHMNVVNHLMSKIFQNYISWCRYLKLESNIKIPITATTQQPELLYIGLYLLIWGEASNVRFMPEYLCYIFHHF